MTPQKVLPELMQVEEQLRRDQFAEHKCLYELHATAWLVARQCNDSHLLRKSARQMLFHLKKMYKFACAGRKMHPDEIQRGENAGLRPRWEGISPAR